VPFYIYEKSVKGNKVYFRQTGKYFSLAGYNILYQLWQKHGKPINKGWHVNSVELVEQWSGGENTYDRYRPVIDYDPKSQWRIGFVEPDDIYVFTHGDAKTGEAWWSPMMWRLKRVFYQTFSSEISVEKRFEIIAQIESFDYSGDDILQFLYLHRDRKGWRFGAAGRTNGAFIETDARQYFKLFF
jgi:hypothetical protein